MDEVHYAITFRAPESGEVTVLRARTVGDSDLGPGFICLSDLVFETASRVANPVEEALQLKYADTRRLHLNVFSIQSIAEVGASHPGLTLETDRSNLVVFPQSPEPNS